MSVVSLEGVHVVAGGRRILNNVSLTVPQHRIVAIVGPNGAGKTTLLDVISGDVATSEGTVTAPPAGRVYQGSPLPVTLTVAEIVTLAIESRPEAVRIADAFGLSAHLSSFVAELSTGMRRILDLAIATCLRPTVLLLDEPSSGLAQQEIAHLARLIRAWRDESGAAVVLVEHDLSLVKSVADEVVVLRDGTVHARGSVARILAESRVEPRVELASYSAPRIRGVADASVASAFAKLFGETNERRQ